MTDSKKKKKNVFRYDGGDADVTWDRRLCIHVGECGRSEGDLFVGGRNPWCQPDLSSVEDVDDVVARCPTGALALERKDGNEPPSPATTNTVLVANQGPLYVSGDLEIDGAADDMPGVRFRAALCRCGRSARKPFCDNSHEEADFSDRGAIGTRGPGGGDAGGPLSVKRIPNGPLFISGAVQLLTGSGRVAWSGTKAALCRCGASKNKPFCDGGHKDAGFIAE